MAKPQTSKKKKSPAKSAGPVNIPDPPAPAAPPAVPQGSASAYAQYLPIAQQFLAGQPAPPYRQDPALPYQNIITGLAALQPHETELATLPAPFDLATMKALPAVALATIYAAAQVDLASPGTIRQLQQTANALRELMLSSAVTLMKSGVLPAPDVKHIMKGRGGTDIAQDCVDLAALFTQYATDVAGKTPITQAHIDEAKSVGDQLLVLLKPKNAPKKTRAEEHPAVAARDALGALLVDRYQQHLRRAGMWIWGDDVDEHVPPLHSHAAAPKPKKTPAEPTNEAATTATSAKTPAPATDPEMADASG